MSQPDTKSPLLAEIRRLSAAQDALALMPTPMLDNAFGSTGFDPMSSSAIVEMQGEIHALVTGATDADLIAAYQETGGEPEALVAEIKRRNLDI